MCCMCAAVAAVRMCVSRQRRAAQLQLRNNRANLCGRLTVVVLNVFLLQCLVLSLPQRDDKLMQEHFGCYGLKAFCPRAPLTFRFGLWVLG